MRKFRWIFILTLCLTVSATSAAEKKAPSPPKEAAPTQKGGSSGTLSAPASRGEPQVATTHPSDEMLKDSTEGEPPQKFQPATPEAAEKKMKEARKNAAEIAKTLKINLATIETPHFIIFTDWQAGEYNFLRTNLEQAYAAVSKQFDIPVSQNVFVGKLPVFMFDAQETFLAYALIVDKFDATMVLGYYKGSSKGHGLMTMWKPMVGNRGELTSKQKEWAYTLVHEFTHAFIARYRTNGFVPRWLNEGLAEVIASRQFPRSDIYPYVRSNQREFDVQGLLKQRALLRGEDYPCVRTMVETLIVGNRKAFLKLFDDIKDGVEFEEALKKHYRVDAAGFEAAWKKYITQAK